MGDLGITRTIEHAVYMLLNAMAIILWRLDAAVIQFSMFSYATQDWLVGREDGGVWLVLAKMIGAEGLFGLSTWQAFLALALTLYGFSLLIRPFWRVRPVDLGRLFFFAALSYAIITEGSHLMQAAEAWRSEAGGYMYEIIAGSGGSVNLDIPGSGAAGDEPLNSPEDLDGRAPIRAWEAVSTSYFLVGSAEELHANIPPEAFRREYCLYDPAEPIEAQEAENGEGCSPAKAWDEWDMVSTGVITEIWGIQLPIDVGVSIPIYQEHPENRQLAIRQAQAGLARLALGPIVALFPMVEANVGLMLTLSASFIYLSLPMVLLFGFFTYTEPMVNRLVMQLISIMIRTMILHGLIALFMMLLISVSINGSLATYLGLVGVGLMGGYFLIKMAGGTMRETLAQSLGAVSSIWVGAAAGTMGEPGRGAAMSAMGAAKWAGAGAVMGAAGMYYGWDMLETSRQLARSGSADLNQGVPGATGAVRQGGYAAASYLPAPLARLAQAGIADITAASGPPPGLSSGSGRQRASSAASGPQNSSTQPAPVYGPAEASAGGYPPPGVEQYAPTLGPANGSGPAASGSSGRYGVYPGDEQKLETWLDRVYTSRERGGRGQRQVIEAGQELIGEDLARQLYQTAGRYSREETAAVMGAVRQAAAEEGGLDRFVLADGAVSDEGLQRIRANLAEPTAAVFRGKQGEQDLEILAAAGLQPQRRAAPEQFRQAISEANAWEGENAAGRITPRKLGLDAVSSGAHFAALNRFAKLSEQAGLTQAQRRQLLEAVREEGELPSPLRRAIETSVRQRQDKGGAAGLKVEDLIRSARALPETLEGPMVVRLAKGQPDKEEAARIEAGRFGRAERAPAQVTAGPQAGRVQTDLKRELKAAARGKRGNPIAAAGPAKFEKAEDAAPGDHSGPPSQDDSGPSSQRRGQIKVTTTLLEEEKIKNAAAKPDQGRRSAQGPRPAQETPQRDPLPSLKGLEEESLIPKNLSSQPGEAEADPPTSKVKPGPKAEVEPRIDRRKRNKK